MLTWMYYTKYPGAKLVQRIFPFTLYLLSIHTSFIGYNNRQQQIESHSCTHALLLRLLKLKKQRGAWMKRAKYREEASFF